MDFKNKLEKGRKPENHSDIQQKQPKTQILVHLKLMSDSALLYLLLSIRQVFSVFTIPDLVSHSF